MLGVAGRLLESVTGAPLSILMYHGVVSERLALRDYCFIPVELFAAQMSWLAESRLQVLPLFDAVARLSSGTLSGATVSITFDDGYRNNIDLALPVLERHRLPASIFLTTGLVGSDKTLWTSRLNIAVERTQRRALDWRGNRYALETAIERSETLKRLKEAVKSQSGAAPEPAVEEIEAALGVEQNPSVSRASPYSTMDTADVETGLASGLIDFGGHTITHPIVSKLDDTILEKEIHGSLDAVQRLTGRPCRSFAYPNGRPEDYDARSMELLARKEVSVAVTTVEGSNRTDADPLQLRRYGVGPNMNVLRFSALANGLPVAALTSRLRKSMT